MAVQKLDMQSLQNTLSQCLAQSKRPLGFLIGAGCPTSIPVDSGDGKPKPLIPDINGLTAQINCNLGCSDSDYSELVSRLAVDLDSAPNVEQILSHIRALASVVGRGTVHDLDAAAINRLETSVTTEISNAVNVELPAVDTAYDSLALWSHAARRDTPIRIFTTNYDLLLESAFERRHVPFFDGFVGTRQPFIDAEALEADDLPPRWARIVKLHGSSNWTVRGNQVIRTESSDLEEQRLIYPSHLKYSESRQMPYLAMFDQLRAFLSQESATLFAVGFSFADDHINEHLGYGLRKNPSSKIFGLQYGKLDQYSAATQLARDHLGLTIAARDQVVDAGKEYVWDTDDEEDSGFDLGDFAQFGEYLMSLIGIRKAEDDPAGAQALYMDPVKESVSEAV